MRKKIEKKFLVPQIIASEFKTLHISKRDFLQRNCLHNDQ